MTVRLDTAKLDSIIAKFPDDSADVVKAGAFALQGHAATLAPFDTGNLKGNINAVSTSFKLIWHVKDFTDYGIFQELGFHHWASGKFIQNAFMRPAVERTQKEYTAMWVALFNRL